jgi:NADP-dependent aldehyde dehydrogenase
VTEVASIDARTGDVVMTVGEESTTEETGATCARAADAFPALEDMGRGGRAGLLLALADGLEAERPAVVAVADRETALGEQRLTGELTRTCFQLRLFAELLDEGSYVEATIDHAGPTPMGPRPDLRRMLVPLGPVAVFGASNFPLAFSVPGGDTAAALAAGCPVVAKAHPSHPATSQLCFDLMAAAAARAGAPDGTLGLVHGRSAGVDLVRHPAIRAVGFTGSYRGGRALFDVANSRPDPIPFYGELGSLNPLVVTPAAAAERAAEIAEG